MDRHAINFGVNVITPGLVERHLPDRCEEVNATMLALQLVMCIVEEQVCVVQPDERCPKHDKGGEGRFGVLQCRAEKEVEIAGGPHETMGVYGDATDHDILNAGCEQRGE